MISTQFWRGYPICMLFMGPCCQTETKKQTILTPPPPCLKLYAAVVSFSWTPGYFSVQAIMRCLFINIIDDKHKAQSVDGDEGCLSGRAACMTPSTSFLKEYYVLYQIVHIGKKTHSSLHSESLKHATVCI